MGYFFSDIPDNDTRTEVINRYCELIYNSNRTHQEQTELRNRLITEALSHHVDPAKDTESDQN